jgi:protein SCO1/2
MFYATCTAICPRIAAEMLRLEKNLSAAQRANTRFLMISFDHERDNPANLRKFIEKMRLTDSFVLLTGKPESIREVAAALGVNYKKQDASTGLSTGDYEYAHSSLFSLLSPQGEIILQHAGLSVSVDNFKEKIQP